MTITTQKRITRSREPRRCKCCTLRLTHSGKLQIELIELIAHFSYYAQHLANYILVVDGGVLVFEQRDYLMHSSNLSEFNSMVLNKTGENAIVEFPAYQIAVTQLVQMCLRILKIFGLSVEIGEKKLFFFSN